MRVKYELKDKKGNQYPCNIYEIGVDTYEVIAKTGFLAREYIGRYTSKELLLMREKGILLEIPLYSR
ncbi:MAG: hypothetical protein IJ473_00560 [Alphaproteobacteria bacterium]|nr:hypothetical protein [Alphaproteobacteria bacterium]